MWNTDSREKRTRVRQNSAIAENRKTRKRNARQHEEDAHHQTKQMTSCLSEADRQRIEARDSQTKVFRCLAQVVRRRVEGFFGRYLNTLNCQMLVVSDYEEVQLHLGRSSWRVLSARKQELLTSVCTQGRLPKSSRK